jgi:hypothetical protein
MAERRAAHRRRRHAMVGVRELSQHSAVSPEAERMMAGMLLYAPLSQDEANRAANGLGFPDDDHYFVDHPDVDEAADDARWIAIDAPESEVIAFESSPIPGLGYASPCFQESSRVVSLRG